MAEIARKKALKKVDPSQVRDSSGVKGGGAVVGAGSGGASSSGRRPGSNVSSNIAPSFNPPRPKMGGQMTMREEMAAKQAARKAKQQGGGNTQNIQQTTNQVQLVEHFFILLFVKFILKLSSF